MNNIFIQENVSFNSVVLHEANSKVEDDESNIMEDRLDSEGAPSGRVSYDIKNNGAVSSKASNRPLTKSQ